MRRSQEAIKFVLNAMGKKNYEAELKSSALAVEYASQFLETTREERFGSLLYAIELLVAEKYIRATRYVGCRCGNASFRDYELEDLTWAGHDLLDRLVPQH